MGFIVILLIFNSSSCPISFHKAPFFLLDSLLLPLPAWAVLFCSGNCFGFVLFSRGIPLGLEFLFCSG